MNEIIVEHIIKKENVLQVDFSFSKGLGKYFSEIPFIVEYPESIEHVPDAIAIIPFICNVLPIVWLTDSKLYVKEIDSDFYNCIDEIKQGYKNMYCGVVFKGEICSTKVIPHNYSNSNNKSMLYSGGLDSLNTLISHYNESIDLVSIWGSDIEFSNESGWEKTYQAVKETAKKFNLKNVVIKSNFREFDREIELDHVFRKQLQDSWWHGVKHGIGLLGHIAPYVYLNNIDTVYIASSNCASDGLVRCASDPTIDNHVKFCGCKVVHDGYQFNRQQKVQNVVEFCRTTNIRVDMHVCWQSQTGKNCCKCEKCYRTISALIAEMANPKDYGFHDAEKTVLNMKNIVLSTSKINQYIATTQWKPIKERIIENKKALKKSIWWDGIKWIKKTDFNNIEKAKLTTTRHMKVMHFFNKKAKNICSELIRCAKKVCFFMSLNTLIEKVYEKKKLYIDKKYIQRKIYWSRRLFKPFSDIVYVIGCPEFSNLGDNAIMIAEIEFLKQFGFPSKHIECITEKEFLKDYKIISKLIGIKCLICGHGGGNMGNQYASEERVRRTMLECFPNNKIIIFPQTIFFVGDSKEKDEQESIKYYNGRANLTLIAREKESYRTMQSLYPDTDILLTPDIVLSAKMETFDVVPQMRKGVLFCLRNDVEKSLSDDVVRKLREYVKKCGLEYSETDMYSDCDITSDNRKNCIRKKMHEFCSAELVITDRLHGMIFAAITNTPCIVFNNYNHKVEGTYQWIKHLSYIRYVNSIEEAEEYIPELLKMRYCQFDNEPLKVFFDKISMLINQKS